MFNHDEKTESFTNERTLDFGARLKYIREYNGLSQRELAKRAGVPHSSISMIEQGLNSPSVNSLVKILTGFPMSIAHFFSCDISMLSEQIFRASDLKARQKNISKFISVQTIPLHNSTTEARFEKVYYSAGFDSGDTPQYSPQAVSGLVLSGSLELTLNSEVSVLNHDDAFSLGPMQPFRLRNVSSSENCIVLTCRI